MHSRSGRHGPRSRNGCSTCRIRKVKCDEQQPTCSRCANACMRCEWNLPPPPRAVANHSVKRKIGVLQSATKVHVGKGNEIDASRSDCDFDSETCQSLAPWIGSIPSSPTSDVEMPNSLILTQQDLKAFQYVPESVMVRKFGKPWRWSMLSYLHSRVAPQDAGVMSAFIAVASMELRFRDLVQYSGSVVAQSSLKKAIQLRNSATKYFQMAIQHLCAILDQVSNREPTPRELEALFSMWFLILHCELYDPELIRASRIHINGIRSFITKYLRGEGGSNGELPPAAQQLLLFITYLDVNLALGNLQGGQLCLDLMSIPRASPLYYDRIWEASRICLPKLWGAEYPPEEVLDDVENYRGLSFIQAGQKLKLSIWQLAVAAGKGKDVTESRQRLWTRIEDIGNEFADLLFLAKAVQNSGGRRMMFTVYHGCLDYYAVRVLYDCLDGNSSAEWLDKTLANLLEIAHKAIGEDPQQLYRFSWPLAVALLKVQDPIHRDWIQNQLQKAKVLLSGLGLPSRLLDCPSPPKNAFLEYDQNVIEEVM